MNVSPFIIGIILCGIGLFGPMVHGKTRRVSPATSACLGCHSDVSPGIVEDWKKSRHSTVSPAEAVRKPEAERRIDPAKNGSKPSVFVVGCAECHTLFPDKHPDTFEHAGHRVHTVVSPADCAACHAEEAEQFKQNIMSHAHDNLTKNPLFSDMMAQAVSSPKGAVSHGGDDSCFQCHGTKVEVKGTQSRETSFGKMEFPVLSGWPNQGVGRVNPDGTKGACTACHARHSFSIEMARKPETCSQCHKGPDVPAFQVYGVSKHGNIYNSLGHKWNFDAVPWKPGKDFTAPTCATCHISRLDGPGGMIVKRTHRMNDRLPWRLFGPVYAHPHPVSPDTTIMKNSAGLPLAVELTGEPVAQFVIDEKERGKREAEMKKVCSACHTSGWTNGHFARLENTIKETNAATLVATKLVMEAWDKGFALGFKQGDSIFNEHIERLWVEQWLFYANSTRIASAMMGADYGVFAGGRWQQSAGAAQMRDWLKR